MSSKSVSFILAAVAVALIITGFFLPPMGKIDGSVIQAVGEIIGIIAIFFAWDSVNKGIDAKITHGNTTIQLTNDKEDEQEI